MFNILYLNNNKCHITARLVPVCLQRWLAPVILVLHGIDHSSVFQCFVTHTTHCSNG